MYDELKNNDYNGLKEDTMQYDLDMQSEYKELFLELRGYLLSIEGMIEIKKTRINTYATDKGGICHMRTMPYGVDIGFLKGAKFTDTYGVLTGTGKAMRVLQIRELNKSVVEHYMNQALAIL